jgi:hypothetical protein
MTDFFDSARWGLIPSGSDVVLYWDGKYATPPAQATRFGKVRWNTVLGGSAVAAHAGACDYEPGNAVYEIAGRLRSWALERQAMNKRSRVYVGRNHIRQAHSLVGDIPGVVYWVPTLDGKRWSAAELIVSIAGAGVELAEGRLWAVQFAGGMTAKWDESILFGDW